MISFPIRAPQGQRAFVLGGALLAVAGVLALRPLAVTWESIENYAYGWLIPVVAGWFFFERWSTRPAIAPRQPGRTADLLFLGGVLVFLALRPLLESDPTWRSGLWLMMTLFVALVLGWLVREAGPAWARHFAFPVLLLYLCVPWPAMLEDTLVIGLMRTNAVMVHNALAMVGVPTGVSGHIIVLPHCRVGVDEACSGIISLQASLMMGCVLGEVYRLRLTRRVVLALVPLTFALAGNFGRTFFLSAVAVDGGSAAVDRWHDSAGYTLVVFTGVATWLLALLLGRFGGTAKWTAAPASAATFSGAGWRWALGALAAVLVAEAATQAWFGWREAAMPHRTPWSVDLAHTQTVHLGPEIKQVLAYDRNQAGVWQDEHGWAWIAYWFYYQPRPGIDAVLNWHNPMACLPTAGLKLEQAYPPFTTQAGGVTLETHTLRFSSPSGTIYVFWVVYPLSGILPAGLDDPVRSSSLRQARDRLLDAWRGYRGVGMETLETIVQGPTDEASAQAAYEQRLKKMIDSTSPGR
jgi:exosortase